MDRQPLLAMGRHYPGKALRIRSRPHWQIAIAWVLRRDDLVNELGRREREAALSACVSNIHLQADPVQRTFVSWHIATDTVKSTVRVACEGLKAGIRRKF
jgi:hypothetical protein